MSDAVSTLLESILHIAAVHEVETGVKLDTCECLPTTYAVARRNVIAWLEDRGRTIAPIEALRAMTDEFIQVRRDLAGFTFVFGGVTFTQRLEPLSTERSQVGFALYRRT